MIAISEARPGHFERYCADVKVEAGGFAHETSFTSYRPAYVDVRHRL